MEKFFLGANSSEGFYSEFANAYETVDGWRAFIIKGGAGTGKSSFMRKVARAATEKGKGVICCPCSSDPDSLDAVIIESEKIIFMDGTAPHIVEPRLWGATDCIINLGEFWNKTNLYNKRNQIVEKTRINKSFHQKAADYLCAAGSLLRQNFEGAKRCLDQQRRDQLKLLYRSLIPEKTGQGREWVRFLSGVTPKGVLSFTETVDENYKNVFIIPDLYGAASNQVLTDVRERLNKNGYNFITVKSPFLPSLITEHILIPEISVAFVSENRYFNIKRGERSESLYKQLDETFDKNLELVDLLIENTVEQLIKAKSSHDQLEALYIPEMDFETMNIYTEKLIKSLF